MTYSFAVKVWLGGVILALLICAGIAVGVALPGRETSSIGETIILPHPRYDSKTSIEKALLERRSVREYKNDPLSLSEISQLLWSAQGTTDRTKTLRTAPSAGALYPLEIYIVAVNVKDLPPGIYRYKPQGHKLITIMKGDKRAEVFNAAFHQSPVKEAPAIIVFSAVFKRTTAKYGERGTRYVHMEAGHAAQNVYLQAVSLDLGTVVIGAFDDDELKRAMNMPREEEPLYIMPVGRK